MVFFPSSTTSPAIVFHGPVTLSHTVIYGELSVSEEYSSFLEAGWFALCKTCCLTACLSLSISELSLCAR